MTHTKQPFNPLLVPYMGEKCAFCGFVFETQEQMQERKMTMVPPASHGKAPCVACMKCYKEQKLT